MTDKAVMDELVDVLIPAFSTERERQALLFIALGDNAIYRRVDLSGSPQDFTETLLATLKRYDGDGKRALRSILLKLQEQVGLDHQARIEQVLLKLDRVFVAAPPADQRRDVALRRIRIFLSSPSDVADERALARRVIEELRADPILRDVIYPDLIAWDDLNYRAPMLATLAPQEAILKGMPSPSECDIAVFILWSRLGTPLDPNKYRRPDGSNYRSGTEWEFENAMEVARAAGKPYVLVYRRTQKVALDPDDPDFEHKTQQYRGVKSFFDGFRNPDGSAKQSYTEYPTPEYFRQYLEADLRLLVKRILYEEPDVLRAETADDNLSALSPRPLWDPEKSPFPGLDAFTPAEAPVFFGRGRETGALVDRVRERRIVAVVGASGSGKSSLVGAGLIPRLMENAIEGSKDWEWCRFTPGGVGSNPMMALAVRLEECLPDAAARTIAEALEADPSKIIAYADEVLRAKPSWSELFLYIDQFEELFTLCDSRYHAPFTALLAAISTSKRVRAVITLRADYYNRSLTIPLLASLLEDGSFPLAIPDNLDLLEMIERPAEVAAITLDGDLARRIVREMGSAPGGLALMGYLLDELYKRSQRRGDRRITLDDYQALGGVVGAIGARAADEFDKLDDTAKAAIPELASLIAVLGTNGVYTRRRARASEYKAIPGADALIAALVKARLLTTGEENREATVEVAHEALFSHWDRLTKILDADRAFQQLKQQLTAAAAHWNANLRKPGFLLPPAQVGVIPRPLRDRAAALPDPEVVTFFNRSVRRANRQRMIAHGSIVIASLTLIAITVFVGQQVFLNLSARSPMIEIAAGEAQLGMDRTSYMLPRFFIDRYEVTWRQYRLCMEAGVCSPPSGAGARQPAPMPGDDNFPVAKVDAYQAAQFCGWIGLRLPTAAEWERAARGTTGRLWPWGDEEPSPDRVNMPIEAFLNLPEGAIAVDDPEFLDGATPEGVMHMIGNMLEWTSTPADCEDPYTCTPWDGRSAIDALLMRGLGWNTAYTPSNPIPPIIEGIPANAAFAQVEDVGFRCASF